MAAATKNGEAPLSLEEYQKKQAAEWGQYIATGPIFVGGCRAFNEGDPVPAGHVRDGLVSKDQVRTVPAEKQES